MRGTIEIKIEYNEDLTEPLELICDVQRQLLVSFPEVSWQLGIVRLQMEGETNEDN